VEPTAKVLKLLVFISVTFEASLGISDIIKHNLLPFILGISPDDMTNFNALKLSSLVTMDPDVQASNPPKTFKWTLNGTSLDLTPNRFTISPTGQLSISSGSLSDEGEYQFFVSQGRSENHFRDERTLFKDYYYVRENTVLIG